MSAPQRPLELILARNLMSNLDTPAVLTDEAGALVFYNAAAARLLGRPFDEVAELGDGDMWRQIGPSDGNGGPASDGERPLALALRHGAPAHGTVRVRSLDGRERDLDMTALPIVSAQGPRGAIAFLWPAAD